MFSSSGEAKLGDAGGDVLKLGFSRIAKRSARMRFWLSKICLLTVSF